MYKWYVLNTMAGKESKARRDLLQRVESRNLQRFFRQVIVPTEMVTETKDNHKVEKEQRVVPGYMLVEMEMNGDTWDLVKGTPNISGFTGGQENQEPPALSKIEVNRLLGINMHQRTQKTVNAFEVGQEIKIIDGPMTDFSGTISEVDEAQRKLKILVAIFGRETPVEVSYDQVRA